MGHMHLIWFMLETVTQDAINECKKVAICIHFYENPTHTGPEKIMVYSGTS